jgi:hypothetical protein
LLNTIAYTNNDAQTGIIGVPVSATSPDPIPKSTSRKSLLSTLLSADAEPLDILLAETIFDGEWEFGFWHYDGVGTMCTFRCPQDCVLWRPVETPSYTGRVRAFDRGEHSDSKFDWIKDDLD